MLRMVPRRLRFDAAVALARLLQPFIRRSRAFRARERLRTDTIRETSLEFVLLMLTRHGTHFDSRLTMHGGEALRPQDQPRATLLVAPHTMLSPLIIRYFYDQGLDLAVISPDVHMKVPGTSAPVHIVRPTRTLFVAVRELFAQGATVGAMLDRAVADRRTRDVATKRGDMRVSTPLLELALRQGVRVLFMTARLDSDWNVHMHLAEPRQDATTTVDELVAAFARFVDLHVHARTSAGDDAGDEPQQLRTA